ncbi:MaoC/PaaZ C-terminal domain-containing protein [Rhodococcus sp. A14]|uniref:MaoC/PaaZ C-terminal domain-containing protein n=1 Tax=Rhodococcus sp. A14 TaxID=1194106 RepID=UPI00141DC98E|nr:dehydratase [Rhodococcus sp. A14]
MNHAAADDGELRYAEDLAVGDEYDLGEYLVTAEEIMSFADHWDPLHIHTDVALAEASHFGTIIASGVHTLAVFQRLAVNRVFGNWHIVAGRALREVQFRAPVRADTYLRGTFSITAIGNTHPYWDRVTTIGTLSSRDSQPVMTLQMEMYVRRRPRPSEHSAL